MKLNKARCLVLACGNTLRGDDGVGPWLAQWAEKHFASEPGVRVISRQQWTLELVEEIAATEAVLFVDCSIAIAAGTVSVADVQASAESEKIDTHEQGASELLSLARDLYSSLPRAAMLLTVGAGSLELGEEFSAEVKAALPEACAKLNQSVMRLLAIS